MKIYFKEKCDLETLPQQKSTVSSKMKTYFKEKCHLETSPIRKITPDRLNKK